MMKHHEKKCFEFLKEIIGKQLRSKHPEVPENISEWKGSEIMLFQDDLLERVNGRVSEKWFYTHIKSSAPTLPRVDMLDLLSQYAGYKNWNELKNEVPTFTVRKYLLGVAISLVLALIIYSLYANTSTDTTFTFCFVNSYSKVRLKGVPLDIEILKEKESSIMVTPDVNGCFTFQAESGSIRFVVRTPYYETDTFSRVSGNQDHEEFIRLRPDDYAQVIHLISNGTMDEWTQRKKDLELMFHDHARIYQVFEDNAKAVAVYNKEEFISKLMLPTKALKNLELVDIHYQGVKIDVLRFKQEAL